MVGLCSALKRNTMYASGIEGTGNLKQNKIKFHAFAIETLAQ